MKKIRRRRRWFEFNENAKAYHDRNVKKWVRAGMPLSWLKLPRGFTCYHYAKSVPLHERLHFAIIIALAGPRGQLEYDMLEIDRAILRRVRK